MKYQPERARERSRFAGGGAAAAAAEDEYWRSNSGKGILVKKKVVVDRSCDHRDRRMIDRRLLVRLTSEREKEEEKEKVLIASVGMLCSVPSETICPAVAVTLFFFFFSFPFCMLLFHLTSSFCVRH